MSFSPSGTELVWARKAGKPRVKTGDVDLFRSSVPGGSVSRMTRDRGSDSPLWGRPGIAFARFEPFKLLHPPVELWLMQPDGSGLRRISEESVLPFAWSDDGQRLLTIGVSEVDTRPYAIDLARGEERMLVRHGGEVFTDGLSRDGRWVLVVDNRTLVQISWSGKHRRVLARGVDEIADWTR